MIYLAILVVLITEAAKVREHLWAGVTHEHWAKRPIWPRLPASDAFHVASAMSHYPIILALLWATESPWWAYIIVAILSQAIWWQAKSSEGRDWPNKGEQLWNWISRFKS
jgi:hypothetical protein